MIKTRLIGLLSHSKKYILLQVFWQWISLMCQILIIYSVTTLIEIGLVSGLNFEIVGYRIPVLAGAILLRVICDVQNTRASYKASVDVKHTLREKIYSKLLRLGASYRENVSTSEVVQMAAEGVEQLEIYFGKYLSQFLYSLIAPLTLFAILAFVDFKASLVLLICVPLIPISIVAIQKIAKRLLKKYWGSYTELGDSFLESLQGLTTLKIYKADRDKAMEMDMEAEKFRRITMKVLMMQLNSISVMDIVAYGGAAAGMIVVLFDFRAGAVGLSGTLMIILLAAEFFIPLRLLGSFFHIAMNGMAASDKIFAFLDVEENSSIDKKIQTQDVNMKLSAVNFSYEEDRQILKNIDMEFPTGSFTSIVGRSGCGKSTIAGLLTARNKGYKGSIEIAGIEIKDVEEASLMNTVTIVNFNSHIFKGSIEDNLKIAFRHEESSKSYHSENGESGKEEENKEAAKVEDSRESMKEALEKVNLLGFIESQQGLETKIAENGANLSGGQRQRLALARALLHDTPVYIFDEATSNIDVESEELIMAVIKELAKTKTVVLISHRLANVVDSNRIYMMKDGEVVEFGRHDELLAKGSYYCELYEQQNLLEAYRKENAV